MDKQHELYYYELPDAESGPKARQVVLWKGQEVTIDSVKDGLAQFGDFKAPIDAFSLSENGDLGSGAGGWEITDIQAVQSRFYPNVGVVKMLSEGQAEELALAVFRKKVLAIGEAFSGLYGLEPGDIDQSKELEGIITLIGSRSKDNGDGLGSGEIKVDLHVDLGESSMPEIRVNGELWQSEKFVEFIRIYLKVMAGQYLSLDARMISETAWGAAAYGAMEAEWNAGVNALPNDLRAEIRDEIAPMKSFM
ncbi:hypothetical protein ACFL3C_04425 [Patescibacteria group bacterium]